MTDKPDKALTFAEQINAAHQEHIKSAKGTLDYATKAGELLILAKETVDAENDGKRGKWEDWLNDHCPNIPETTARMYMRLAKGKDHIRKQQRVVASLAAEGKLSIRAALQLIPKTQKELDRAAKAKATREEKKAAEKSAVEPPAAAPKSGTIEDNLLNMDVDDLFTALRDNWDNNQLAKLTLKLGDHLKSLGVPPPTIRRRENEAGQGQQLEHGAEGQGA
jgi:hypothetical protein